MSPDTRPTFSEHDSEPVPGLPGPLPAGEAILWQGKPHFEGLAKRALHLRWLTAYFVLMAMWRATILVSDGAGALEVAQGTAFILLLGLAPIILLAAYGWLSARSTIYTITNRRVVVRTGVALPMTVNIPFALIANAAVARHNDGTGDIALEVGRPHRLSWIALWPYVRSWHMLRPQAAIRAVPEPERVADILGRALAASAAMPVRVRAQSVAASTAGAGAEAVA